MKMMKKWHKVLGIVSLLAVLTVLLVPIPHKLDAEDGSADGGAGTLSTGGLITLDKWRDKYSITSDVRNPNKETTKVHLKATAAPVTDKSPVNVILTLDMSGSMVYNDVLGDTLTAAKLAAKTITDDNANSKIAIVRYDTGASVYDFMTGQWVLLDSGGAEITKYGANGKNHYYSNSISSINTALSKEKIASVTGLNAEDRYIFNNFPRQNDFTLFFTSAWDSSSRVLTAYSGHSYTPSRIIYGKNDDISNQANFSREKASQIASTNIEAASIVTKLVADMTDKAYPIFMTDGVPTAFQFSSPTLEGNFVGNQYSYLRNVDMAGTSYVGTSFLWDSLNHFADTDHRLLPIATDPARVQGVAASAALKAAESSSSSSVEKVFAIGVNQWSSAYPEQLQNGLDTAQRDILTALTGSAGDNKSSFITANPSENISNIYTQIANEIIATPITSSTTISDVIPAEFDVMTTEAELLAEARALDPNATVSLETRSDGKTYITWTFPGGLVPNKPIEVTYDIKAKYGVYGISDTNESATLSYDEFCPRESIGNDQDPNRKPEHGTGPVTIDFPEPQVKIMPSGGQYDHYAVPRNSGTYTLSSSNVTNLTENAVLPKTGVINTEDYITGNDNDGRPITLIDDGDTKGYYDDRDTRDDAINVNDQDVQPLKIVLRPGYPGNEGITGDQNGIMNISYPDSNDLTKVELQYQPNPNKNPENGYSVTYWYRYQSTDDDTNPAYYSTWYAITIDVPPNSNKASIEFKKTGDGGTPLNNVPFALYADADDDGDPDGNILQIVFTGTNGVGTFTDVDAGNYLIREVAAPADYVPNENYYKVTVTAAQQQAGEVVRLGTDIPNELAKGSIKLKKVDERGQPLKDAVFDLYASSDTGFTTSLGQETSGDDGVVTFTNVKAGKYKVKETSPPAGYSGGFVSGEIYVTSTVVGQLSIDLGNVVNTHNVFDLEILKKGEGVDSEKLKGAVFELYDADGATRGQFTSNDDGLIQITSLPYGTYTLKEVQAPTGYSLLTSEYTIVVSGSEQKVTVNSTTIASTWTPQHDTVNAKLSFTIANKKMPELPKTGGPGIAAFILIGGGLMTYGINGLKKPKHTKKGNRSEK